MFFKKNEKIKFYCELPEIKEKYPIIEAKKYNFDWFTKSSLHFKEIRNEKSKYQQITGVVRCPGVKPIMNSGYIVRAWFDLTVVALSDENRFEFFYPQGLLSYLKDRNYDKRLISWFSGEDPAHKIPLPDGYLQTLIKINLPWAVSIPKGWNLMLLPIPYPDSTDFECVHGILNEGDYYQLNAIMKIKSLNKEFKIPAGTPLFQLIPIQDSNVDIEILDYDREIKEKEIERNYLSNHQFVIK